MNKKDNLERHDADVLSHVPGRVRIRIAGRKHLRKLKERLAARNGIHSVRSNEATGSVTVHYDEKRYSKEKMLALLEDFDVVARQIGGDSPGSEEAVSSSDFMQAIEDLSLRLSALTGMRIDLKLALPLAFASAGLWSIRKRGLMVAQVPGWLFLWMAFDIFIKLHPPHRQTANSHAVQK